MAVVSERLDHVGAGADELAVELAHRLWGVEHHLRHIRPRLEAAAPLQLEQIALGADRWPLGQPLQQSVSCHCALPCLLWRLGWPRGGPGVNRRRRARCGSRRIGSCVLQEPAPGGSMRSGRQSSFRLVSPRLTPRQARPVAPRGRRRRPPTSLSPGRSVRRSWCCPRPIGATDLTPSLSPSMAEPHERPGPRLFRSRGRGVAASYLRLSGGPA